MNPLIFFGSHHQIQKTIEELNELGSALSRYLNCNLRPELYESSTKEKYESDVISELADCKAMLAQMTELFGTDRINAEIERKEKRTNRTIELLLNGMVE